MKLLHVSFKQKLGREEGSFNTPMARKTPARAHPY